MLNRNRGDNILELKKRPSRLEKGVSLCREEPLLASKKRPIHLQTIVFTPLSIRRGDGGEASLPINVGVCFNPCNSHLQPLRHIPSFHLGFVSFPIYTLLQPFMHIPSFRRGLGRLPLPQLERPIRRTIHPTYEPFLIIYII